MMKQGLVTWTWETRGRFAAGSEGSVENNVPGRDDLGRQRPTAPSFRKR